MGVGKARRVSRTVARDLIFYIIRLRTSAYPLAAITRKFENARDLLPR
jgi:hypothetical protein